MEPFRFHLFVCTQQKPEGVPSCPASGSFAVLGALDREIQARGLGHDVQLTTCGCMGLCDEGPVMVVYPAGVWYRRVQPSDIRNRRTHLGDGKPVDRLVWNDASCDEGHGDRAWGKVPRRDGGPRQSRVLPDRLDQMIRGYMPSRCILTALELDIFTAVGEGANAEQIGTRIHANARAVGMLLNALVALGLLSKSGDDYKNTPSRHASLSRAPKTTTAMVCCTPPTSGIAGAH
jgi:(2Fe-2S) ferredoxin